MSYKQLATLSRLLWDDRLPRLASDELELWDMQGEVIDLWIENNTSFEQWDKVCDDPVLEQRFIEPWADDILGSPELMLIELGYKPGDFASYVNDRRNV